MPRKNQGWITFQAASEEREILEAYCQQTQRSKTDVLRELIRHLEPTDTPLEFPQPSANMPSRPDAAMPPSTPFQVSARNLLPGRITNLYRDGVNTEVTLEVAPRVTITSVITSASAQRLELKVGKVVYAMVKSSNVMIATSTSLEQVVESLLT